MVNVIRIEERHQDVDVEERDFRPGRSQRRRGRGA